MYEVIVERFFSPAPGGRGYSTERVAGKCETEAEAKIKVASLKNEHTGEYYVSYRKMKEKETKMTTKITAAEARELAGPTVPERVETVYGLIRAAAEAKRRSVDLHGEFWANQGYSATSEWQEACRLLEADGYTVGFVYEERQFVSMYTEVKW
jgi:hypothetical protein